MLTLDTLKGNIIKFKEEVAKAAEESGRKASDIEIVAAIKTQPMEIVAALKSLGIDKVGDNRVQEMTGRYNEELGLEWHFIGQLQSNKVKYIIDKVALIHSLDRLSLADAIEDECGKRKIFKEALIEVNIGGEESKGGLNPDDALKFIEEISSYDYLRVKGLMSVMPIVPEVKDEEPYLRIMKELFDSMRHITNVEAKYLSMGMSGDYALAIKCGSNMVRPGRVLFGERR